MPITAVDHRITLNEALENLEEIGYSTAELQGNKWRDGCDTLLNSIQAEINRAISDGIANGSFGENDSALKNTIETAMKDPLTRTLSRHTWAKIDAIGAQVTISDGHGEAKQISLSKLLTNFYKLREALNRKQAIKAQLEHEEKIRENREAIAKLDEEGKKKLRELINNQNTPAETLSKTDGIYNGGRGAYFVLYDDSGKTTVRVEKWSESNLRKAFTEAFSPGDKVHIVGWSALSPEDQRVAIQVAFEAGIDVVDSELYQLGFRVNNSPADNLAVLYNLEYGFNHGSKSRPGWLNDKMLTNLRELSTNQLKDEHAAIEAEKEVLGNQFSKVKEMTGDFSSGLLKDYGPSDEALEGKLSNDEDISTWFNLLEDNNNLLNKLRDLYKNCSKQEEFRKALDSGFDGFNISDGIKDQLAADLVGLRNDFNECLIYEAAKGQLHVTASLLYGGEDGQKSTDIEEKLNGFIESKKPDLEHIQLMRLQENIDDLSIFQSGIIKNDLASTSKLDLPLSNFPSPQLTQLNPDLIGDERYEIKLNSNRIKQEMQKVLQLFNDDEDLTGLKNRLAANLASANPSAFTLTGPEFKQFYAKINEGNVVPKEKVEAIFHSCINNLQNAENKQPITVLTASCVIKLLEKGVNDIGDTGLALCALELGPKNSSPRSKLLKALEKLQKEDTGNKMLKSVIAKLKNDNNQTATINLQDYQRVISFMKERNDPEFAEALQACQTCPVLKSEIADKKKYITVGLKKVNSLNEVEQLISNADDKAENELKERFAVTLKPVQVNDILQLVSELDKLYGDNKDPELAGSIASVKEILKTKNEADNKVGEVKLDLKGLIAIQNLATKASVKLQEAKRKVAPSMARFLTQEKQFSYKFKKPSYKNNLKNEQQTLLTKIEENIRKKLGISMNSEANPEEPNEAPVNNA